MKLGAARAHAPKAWRLIEIEVAENDASFSYRLNRSKLKKVRRREGRYLLRTNLTEQDPVKLWEYYLQLVAVNRHSRISKAISPSAPSITNSSRASRRTFSSPFSPIACMSL